MLRTSDFVDDVMFSHTRANGKNQRGLVCFVEFTRWRHRGEVCSFRLHVVAFGSFFR